MSFRGLIFDFNGVLLIDQHLHDQVFRQLAQEIMGRLPTEEEFRKKIHGRTNRLIFEFMFGRTLNEQELKDVATKKELAYQSLSRQEGLCYRLSAGAEKLLSELKQQGIPYTIATSSPTMNISFFNDMLGLDRWFDLNKIVCDDGTLPGKPAPDIYLRAAQVLNMKPNECVVIEDARSGITAAHNAGIGYIIAIGPKETHDKLRVLDGVNDVIESLSEIEPNTLFSETVAG